MLNLFRRHNSRCTKEYAERDRTHKDCACTIHVEGMLAGVYVRASTKTANWKRANSLVTEAEARGKWEEEKPPDKVTVLGAAAAFTLDAKARSLAPATMKKYRVLLDQLRAFAEHRGIVNIEDFGLEETRAFREGWKDGSIAGKKKLERARSFFRFCVQSGWMEKNPALLLKAPKTDEPPTLPFEIEEIKRIYKAIEEHEKDTDHSRRLRPLVQLLLHSGLRIGDAVTLSAARIKEGRLFLYTQKTKVMVHIPLPGALIEVLGALPLYSKQYFFWTGEGKPDTAVGNWRRSLREVFKRAGLTNAHPHRFRDTFAVNLLRKGVPLERVSKLLGHQSIKITEKHYFPWVKTMQDQLEEDIKKTWDIDNEKTG